jgi:hypothetical protein
VTDLSKDCCDLFALPNEQFLVSTHEEKKFSLIDENLHPNEIISLLMQQASIQ